MSPLEWYLTSVVCERRPGRGQAISIAGPSATEPTHKSHAASGAAATSGKSPRASADAQQKAQPKDAAGEQQSKLEAVDQAFGQIPEQAAGKGEEK